MESAFATACTQQRHIIACSCHFTFLSDEMKRVLLLEPPPRRGHGDEDEGRSRDERSVGLSQQMLSMPTLSGTLSVYSRFLNTSLLRAYQKMEAILGTKKLRSPTEKLSTLEQLIRDSLVYEGKIPPKIASAWNLVNSGGLFSQLSSSIFSHLPDPTSINLVSTLSPLAVVLNCAPAPGLFEKSGNGWTPDYLSAIISSIIEEGAPFPRASMNQVSSLLSKEDDSSLLSLDLSSPSVPLPPLVLEFRAVCPAMFAALSAGLSSVSETQSFHDSSPLVVDCATYGECLTPPADRRLQGHLLDIASVRCASGAHVLLHLSNPSASNALRANACDQGKTLGQSISSKVFVTRDPESEALRLNFPCTHPGHDIHMGLRFFESNVLSILLGASAAASLPTYGLDFPYGVAPLDDDSQLNPGLPASLAPVLLSDSRSLALRCLEGGNLHSSFSRIVDASLGKLLIRGHAFPLLNSTLGERVRGIIDAGGVVGIETVEDALNI